MKRRIFAAALAAALALSLTACGGNGSSSSNPGSSSSGVSSSQPDGSNPDGSPVVTPDPKVTLLTLNKTEVTLNKAGATFQLRYTVEPDVLNYTPVYGTSNTQVATVSADGTITAVAPGTAVITVDYGDATAECTVTCDWTEETKPEPKPDPKPETKPDPKPSEPEKPAASNVDLQKFYNDVTGKYEFGFLELADSTFLEQLYPGLSGVGTEQMLVYITMMTMNNGEFGLVQVKNAKDVDTVKAIFQARIKTMVGDDDNPGAAWYPSAIDQWANNSRVVSNGNYVMMIVHENCDDIVKEFNALF